MFQIGSVKIPHRLLMAPMCGITHMAYRGILKKFGAGLVYTQMVSAKALEMQDQKSFKLLQFNEFERPVGFQIFGNDANVLAKAAKICEDLGADLLDLNMGCPAKKIVAGGGGSALLKNLNLSALIFEKIRAAIRIPFTIKVRAGWDQYCGDFLAIAKLAEQNGVDAITLHARTKAQGYSGKADWDLVSCLKSEIKIPVIGNGDIMHFSQVNNMLTHTGCDAVMVGRAAVNSPWFFKSYLAGKEYQPTLNEMKTLILEQYDAFFSYFGQSAGIKQMRKHLCAQTVGLRDGSKFRNAIVRMDTWEEIQKTIKDFFDEKNHVDIRSLN
ncbi:MAG: tRNA dihydrouridine synthase DusB [Deltaproteobacteria bacterium RIFCSPLOWO2_12_FULL_40_28]|nr:MAG: tRNA dihydrouridine synthase DusB [Deltaproteobacteria bacterium RIFCSPHIGHO2_02_FULL_40_28]OGQ19094.1 MAG: tRNA dihydrouridine synthase DusB [Deltaproteobacteria bacterium RIFCSPHIGHO2_12_FULL_40_32]OGQ40266.1 MAG: tRNA dihydrouridine synthase DusB [Deltaproteobacteria bacterium RIFCSPLOWO2_02_FULL_40_36]OGQ53537.1 MAG: tRNA dihydrouridine synthase DusB [Deltaproteobacteria bacterium RIFCSPLOWO2_12_FULL_40_28]